MQAPCWWESAPKGPQRDLLTGDPPGGRAFCEGGRRGSASPRGCGAGEDRGQWRPGTAEGEEQRPELGVGSPPGNGGGCPRPSPRGASRAPRPPRPVPLRPVGGARGRRRRERRAGRREPSRVRKVSRSDLSAYAPARRSHSSVFVNGEEGGPAAPRPPAPLTSPQRR